MKKHLRGAFVVMCVLAVAVSLAAPARAQSSDTKEKPPMYSYVSNWTIPRAQWAEMAKNNSADEPILSKAMSAGTIMAYGDDADMVHQADGSTHDQWWSSMSMAGLLNVLEQFYKAGNAATPVLETATKHSDNIYVSRYYNYHAGSYKGVYTRVATYALKPDASSDAVEALSKHLFVPMLEKLLSDGAIHEYEIDTEAIHTEDPGTFSVVVIAASAEGLDKFNAAVQALHESHPLAGPAIASMVDFSKHRDYLARTNATFK